MKLQCADFSISPLIPLSLNKIVLNNILSFTIAIQDVLFLVQETRYHTQIKHEVMCTYAL